MHAKSRQTQRALHYIDQTLLLCGENCYTNLKVANRGVLDGVNDIELVDHQPHCRKLPLALLDSDSHAWGVQDAYKRLPVVNIISKLLGAALIPRARHPRLFWFDERRGVRTDRKKKLGGRFQVFERDNSRRHPKCPPTTASTKGTPRPRPCLRGFRGLATCVTGLKWIDARLFSKCRLPCIAPPEIGPNSKQSKLQVEMHGRRHTTSTREQQSTLNFLYDIAKLLGTRRTHSLCRGVP